LLLNFASKIPVNFVCITGAEVNKQAVLCHRVLRMLQTVAQSSTSMSEETWHTLLLFLLHINSALLAPPSTKGMLYLSSSFLLPCLRFLL
jgi:hypothetical protein